MTSNEPTTEKTLLPEGMVNLNEKFRNAKPRGEARVVSPGQKDDGTDEPAESSTASGVTGESPSPQESPSSDEPEHKSEKAANRYKELADQNAKLKAELDRERAEAQKLREATSPAQILAALKSDRPNDYDEWSEDDRQVYVAQKAAQHEADRAMPPEVREQVRRVLLKDFVMDSDPSLSRNQAAAVAEVLDEFDNRLSVKEAVTLAAHRKAELFAQPEPKKEAAKPKADAAAFHAQAPGRAEGKKMSALDREEAELMEQISTESNSLRRNRLVARVNSIRAQRRRK